MMSWKPDGGLDRYRYEVGKVVFASVQKIGAVYTIRYASGREACAATLAEAAAMVESECRRSRSV